MLTAFKHDDYLAVRIRAEPQPPRTSLHLGILLDVSDSMEGERLVAVKKTLHAGRDLFTATDRVTLVLFGTESRALFRNHLMTEEGKVEFYSAVDALRTEGCTNLGSGLSALLPCTYDAVLLLTDGQVNRGVTSTAGLRSMALGLGPIPYTLLGYGADHNRILLRDIALQSRGSYTYVDSDELLPAAMGDLIAGLRTEVSRRAIVTVPGYICKELSGGESSYMMGEIVADRDYWVIFQGAGDPAITLTAGGQVLATQTEVNPGGQEQVLRCRATTLLAAELPDRQALTAFLAEIEALPPSPLLLRIRAQITEILETPILTEDVSARLAAQVSYLSTQRGAGDEELFSSPAQRVTSSNTRVAYANSRVAYSHTQDPGPI